MPLECFDGDPVFSVEPPFSLPCRNLSAIPGGALAASVVPFPGETGLDQSDCGSTYRGNLLMSKSFCNRNAVKIFIL